MCEMPQPLIPGSEHLPPRRRQWARTRWKRLILASLLGVFLLMNLVAYLHARAFTRFAPAGTRLPSPQSMTFAQKLGVLFTGASHPRPVNDIDPGIVKLPFSTLTIPSDDLQLEAWHIPCENARSMVVLFHGHGACKCSLLREARAFHDLGCECLLVDFRAGGGSTGEICTLGVEEADDVGATVRLARDLAPKLPIILFGQSMGGAAILRAVALDQAQADGLIVESTFDRLFTTVQHRFELMGIPTFPMARLLVFWGGAQHGFNAFAHNPVDYARRVTIPTMLMIGAKDAMVRESEVESIHTALAGPKSLHVFPDTGHESYLFRCPDKWTELVHQFLNSRNGS